MCRVCRVRARPLHTCDPHRIWRVQGVQGVQGCITCARVCECCIDTVIVCCSHVRARISPAHPAQPNKHGAFTLHSTPAHTLHTLHRFSHAYPQLAF